MTLKAQLKAKTPLVGTFLKTPSAMTCEVLGRTALDLICIDAEHAPFDRRDIDACLHALHHAGKPSLVRIPTAAPEHILNALDCGASGIIAPHITDGRQASRLLASSHFGTGRGFAGSTRSAGYGARSMSEHKRRSTEEVVVVAQIEDAEALDHLSDIFAVREIDAFFIGRADLAMSMGADNAGAPEVVSAVEAICRTGQAAGATIGMFTPDLAEIAKWRALGASLFLLSSDHAMMLAGADALVRTVRPQL
ncbi:MAG: HpcH/HpaI aldolase family protein [Hyphomonas sp.]